MNIGSQIKERRTVLHMTQDELADKLNVSRSAISNWETEKNYPDLQLIVMLSEVLDVSLDDLLKGDANVVEKISKDTKESKKLRTRTKVLIVVIGVLLVLMAGYFTVFAGLKYDISDSSHIKNMELIGNNIEVKHISNLLISSALTGSYLTYAFKEFIKIIASERFSVF